MALNSSGPISLAGTTAGQSIELENGGNGTTQISLNDAAVRSLAGVASGAITMPTDFYGKSNVVNISYTFSTNTANASLNLSSISGYSAGKSNITVTVNSGVYLYATSTGSYGLTITGGTTGDTLVIVNNGYIMGMGGSGAGYSGGAVAPTVGGPALNLGFGMTSCTITNTSGYIGGGGGGGGYSDDQNHSGGGGAGGGRGGPCTIYQGKSGGNSGYVPGGNPGSAGSNGNIIPDWSCYAGGGGGRIMPGVGGSGGGNNSPGSGPNPYSWGWGGGAGGGGGRIQAQTSGGNGGAAGSVGQDGTVYFGSSFGSGGGGGYGAKGGNGKYNVTYGQGVNGGKGVNLNSKSVTWTGGSSSTSRVYGTIS